jgi:hypothetical protein
VDIAARSIETCDKAKLDRIATICEHDRYCGRRGFCRESRDDAAGRGDDGHITLDEIGGKRRQSIETALCPAILDDDIPALNVTDFVQAFSERKQL